MEIDIAGKLFPNITTLVVQLCSTGIMLLIFKKFLWVPVQEYFAKRADFIEGQINEAKDMNEKELNRTIKEQAPSHDKLIINNPESKHNICAGLIEDLEIEINGSAGYFVGTMVDGPKIHINGNAGWFAGDNMTEGELIIEGTAGDGAGQGIYGGTVVVKGNTGSRTGEIMKGGTVIIGGNSGYMTGLLMMGGRLIILGDVTDDVGESIMRGTIYVLGTVKSLGKNAIMEQATLEDQKELKEILSKYDFELTDNEYTNFKKIVNIQ